jgi:hypothetical protein
MEACWLNKATITMEGVCEKILDFKDKPTCDQ